MAPTPAPVPQKKEYNPIAYLSGSSPITTPQFATSTQGNQFQFKDGSVGSKTDFTKYTPPTKDAFDWKNFRFDEKAAPQASGAIASAGTTTEQKAPLPYSVPTAPTPKIQEKKAVVEKKGGLMDSIIPKANAYEPSDEELQSLIDQGYSNEEIAQAINDISMDEQSSAPAPMETKKEGWAGVNIPAYKPYTEADIEGGDIFSMATLRNTGRSLANIAGSTANIVGGIGNVALHPIETTKSLYSIGDGLTDIAVGNDETENAKKAKAAANEIIVKKYGSWEGFKKASFEDPAAIVGDALTLISGGATAAAKVSQVQKAATLNNLRKASVTGAMTSAERTAALAKAGNLTTKIDTARKGAEFANKLNPYFAAPALAVGGLKAGFTKAENISKSVSKTYDQTIANIDPSKKAGYQANPYQKEYFADMTKKADSAEGIDDIKSVQENYFDTISENAQKKVQEKIDGLSETSPVYGAIRELPIQIVADPIVSSIERAIKSGGLDIVEGKIVKNPSISSTVISPSDITKINDVYQGILADATRKKGVFSTSDMLDTRKNIDSLINYDQLASTKKGQEILRDMRKGVDQIAKDQIPGLREIDKNFVDRLDEFKQATQDLVYKQGDSKGDFRSNINAIISNINTPNRAQLKKRLEEIMPDIGERVQAVRNLTELHKSYTTQNIKGKFANAVSGSVAGGSAGLVVGGPMGAIAGAILGGGAGALIESTLTRLKMKRLNEIIGETSAAGREILHEINRKIKNNELLKEKEKQIIKDIQYKVDQAKILNPKLLGPSTGKAPFESSIKGTPPGMLDKTREAIEGKVGERNTSRKEEKPEQLLLPPPSAPKPVIIPPFSKIEGSRRTRPGTTKVDEEGSKGNFLSNALNMSKNNKGFISPRAMGESMGLIKKPVFRKGENEKFLDGGTDKVARERFDIQNLEKIGSGSDRDVYDLGGGKILKVSKSARGLEQTSKGLDYYLQESGIVPKIFENGKNYTVTEKIKQFKDMDTKERKIVNDFIKDMADLRPGYRERADMGKISERLEKYGWEDLANYDMDTFGWGDIRKANIGIKNGKPILIDEGTIDLTSTIENYKGVKNLDDMEFRDIYYASKEIKKKLGDIDKNTMYNIGGFFIGGNILLDYLSEDE